MAAKTLKERMQETAAAAAPSLAPAPRIEAPPPKAEEVVPTLKESIGDKKDYLKVKRLIADSLKYKNFVDPDILLENGVTEEVIKKATLPGGDLHKTIKGVTAAIKVMLGKYKVGVAQEDEIHINYFSGTRKTIKPDLLLAQGVTPAQIKAATEEKSTYTLKITVGDEMEEDEG